MNKFNTYIELLEYRAETHPDDITFTYINDDFTKQESLTYKELNTKVKAVAAFLQKKDFHGKRALLLYTPGLDFIISFLGCLYAGVIAVPAYPPEVNRLAHTMQRIERIIKDSQTSIIFTTDNIYQQTEKILSKLNAEDLKKLLWIASDTLNDSLADEWINPDINENTIAFLQYTSGSTSNPKGVIITHKNLLHNEEMIKLALSHEERKNDVACWVPFYHDMGLIGHLLQSLYVGSKTIIISPMSFLRNPYVWLKIISDNKISSTGAPNFAYDLCVKKITKEQVKTLDLSHMINASNGAEPLRKDTLERFSEYFKETGFKPYMHKPLYGMAEATVFMASPVNGKNPEYVYAKKEEVEKNKILHVEENPEETVTFVSCGRPRLDGKIIVVNPETKEILKDNEIGEIWTSGDHIAQGYWNLPEETEYAFKNYIPEISDKPFLRTGDLGFISNENLYVTGRIKDLIIINGRNIYPQDIEKDIENLRRKYKSIRPGCNAVFSVSVAKTEKIVLFQEIDGSENNFDVLVNDILDLISSKYEVPVESIIFIKSGTIAKTSSGKIMRQACKRAYLKNMVDPSFKIIYRWDFNKIDRDNIELSKDDNKLPENNKSINKKEIENWLKDWLSKELEISNIDTEKNFSYYGLNSALSVALTKDLEDFIGTQLYETILWDYKNIDSLSDYLVSNIKQVKPNISIEKKQNEINANDIAIIGMSCRFPADANTPEQFWDNLNNKVDGIIDIPKSRWNNDQLIELNKTYVKQGGFINDIDKFDPEFFQITQKEAKGTDPQQRLLLELSWEALENSGILPNTLKDSNTGVFIGISSNDYSKADINSGDLSLIDQYSGIGNALSVASGRISYTFGLQGPNLSVDTACSSSLVAVNLACQNLINGDADLCLAGGVNLMLSPDITIYFSQINALSPDSRCKTFDESANGYVRSEGCGIVVLKRLSDAVKDKNNILAVIKSSVVNHDGNSQGLTAPNGQSQIKLMEKSLAKSGLKFNDISYIETHGTGTNLGDPIELRSINQVFIKDRNKENKLILGAVKSSIGHLEASAGIAGLIKTVLCLNKKQIPANLHFQKLNSKSGLNTDNIYIPVNTIDWSNKKRIASVNSFGISGTNANLILENYDSEKVSYKEKEVNILTVSAKNENSLLKNAEAYLEFIKQNNNSINDLCYTTTNLRTHFKNKIACVFNSKDELMNQLNSYLNHEDYHGLIKDKITRDFSPKVAFVYPGHGSQWLDMAKVLIKNNNIFKEWIIEIDKTFKNYVEWSLLEFLTTNKDEAKLDDISIIQPVLFAIQVALSKTLINYNIKPDALIGHSMGEISACFIAGILDLDSASNIVINRSKLMQTLSGDGAMLYVELSYDESTKLLSQYENISIGVCNNYNSVVLSGEKNSLENLEKTLESQNIFNSWVRFNGAAHSYKMEVLKQPLLEKIGVINHQNSIIPFYSSVTGNIIDSNELNSEYWLKNLRDTVFFNKSFDGAINDGCNIFIEISPHNILTTVMKNTIKEKGIQAVAISGLIKNKDENYELNRIIAEVYTSGVNIDWKEIYPEGNLVYLPNYQWDKKSYWKEIKTGVIKNQVYSEISKNENEPEFIIPESPKDWLYEFEFINQDLRPTDEKNSFIIFADNYGISDSLKIILDYKKIDYILVYPKNEYRKINNQNYQIDYQKIEDYKRLFNEIDSGKYNKIVHLWSLEKNIEDPDYNYFKELNQKTILSVINIIKSIEKQRIYVVTNGSIYYNEDKKVNYNQSPILGLGKVANYELPEIKLTNIDISPEISDSETSLIFEEINNNSDENIVLIRDDKRLVQRLSNYRGQTIIKQEVVVENDKGFFNKIFSKKTNSEITKKLPTPEIDGNSTYLIAGGTGGLGILFAKYLIYNGAKNIVLCSRKGLDEKLEKQISQIKGEASIHVLKADISNKSDVEKIFTEISKLPPLKGIIHSALVLNDSSIKTHKTEYFYNVMNPKVQGIINLHNLSKDMNLNFFVMFSSLTSVLGMKYFTNYSASNSFLDSFSYYRRKMGLPSISINWGPWSEIGQAAYYKDNSELDSIGLNNIKPDFGLEIFKEIFKLNPVQIIVMNINMRKYIKAFPESKNIKLYENIFKEQDINIDKQNVINEILNVQNNQKEQIKKDLNSLFNNLSDVETVDELEKMINHEISILLNVDKNKINKEEHFRNYGLDSLMAIEMVNNLSEKIGIDLTFQDLRGVPNVEFLAQYIFEKIKR